MVRDSQQTATMEAAEQSGMHPAVLAAAASVLLSWYAFFVQGNRERGIFIGLWPPTFLAFASYFEQARIHRKIDRLTGGRLTKRVKKMMRSR